MNQVSQVNSLHNNSTQKGFIAFYPLFCLILNFSLSFWFQSYSVLICGSIGSLLLTCFLSGLDNSTILRLCFLKVVGIFFVMLIYYGCLYDYGVPYYIGGSDDLQFEDRAMRMIDRGYYWPWTDNLVVNSKGFNWIISVIMRLCTALGATYHTVCYRILNIDLLLATGVLVYRLSYIRLKLRKPIAVRAMTIMSIFPNALYITSFVFRDTLCGFMIILYFVCADDLFRTKNDPPVLMPNKVCNLLMLISLAFWGYWIRGEMLYIMILIIGISVLRNQEMKGDKLVALLGIFGVVFFIFLRIGAVDTWLFKTDSAYKYHQVEEGSSSLSGIIFNMPIFPLGLVLRIIYGVVFPIPVGLMRVLKILSDALLFADFIVALGMCVQIACLPILFANIAKRLDKYTITFLSIFLIIVISSYTFRHFILVYPFAITMIMREYNDMPRAISRKRMTIGSMALVMGAFMYLLAK